VLQATGADSLKDGIGTFVNQELECIGANRPVVFVVLILQPQLLQANARTTTGTAIAPTDQAEAADSVDRGSAEQFAERHVINVTFAMMHMAGGCAGVEAAEVVSSERHPAEGNAIRANCFFHQPLLDNGHLPENSFNEMTNKGLSNKLLLHLLNSHLP